MIRRLVLAVFVLLMTAGADDPPVAEGATQRTVCTEPRPQMCTREYLPVCGERPGRASHTYGNGCTACSDSAVVAYRPGACD